MSVTSVIEVRKSFAKIKYENTVKKVMGVSERCMKVSDRTYRGIKDLEVHIKKETIEMEYH